MREEIKGLGIKDLEVKQVEDEVEQLVVVGEEIPAESETEEVVATEVEEITENKLEDLVENAVEDPVEKAVSGAMDEPIKNCKKIVIGIVIGVCALLLFYLGMTLYFITHFYFGSTINEIAVSGKSIGKIKTQMTSELEDYILNLKERGEKSEQIKAADVGLTYNLDEELKKLQDSQNPFNWVTACFNTKDSAMTIEVTYDEKRLKEYIDTLSCFDSDNVIEPKNPSIQYKENGYMIIDEILGNKVDKDILYAHIADALLKKEVEVDLESIHCYIQPQYNSKSEQIIKARDTLNKYVTTKIIYTFGNDQEILDASTINQWLHVDDHFKVVMDREKIESYIDALSEKYHTKGRTRNFITSLGETIQVGGGDFARSINKEQEIQNLMSDIKEGKTITKEPVYGQSIVSYGNDDIGNTYVEIDLTKQHIWFYKDSLLIVEGDVVTGNVRSGHTTPKGVYTLQYKSRNAVLRGPGYAAPVSFWMPFNGGIGIHDATWRGSFGGEIYKENGSHGCINCPYSVASEIYNHIESGTPVICY